MAAATLLIGVAYAYWRHGTFPAAPDLERGRNAVWAPGQLMALQLMGLIIFFYT